MADISQVKLPDNSVYDINDATARSGLSDKMDKTNPTGTGALSINRKANTTVGANSVAIGDTCEANADQSYAEGAFTKASNGGAHAEGISTVASGGSAHAEGTSTTASGQAAHAEGYSTTASGMGCHSEGTYTTASGAYGSHAEGNHTTAKNKAQHVFGEYNVADPSTASATSRGTYVEIVGNGTNTTPSNARTLDWQGNETLAGDLIYNGDTSLTNKLIYEKTVSGSIATFTDGGNNIPCKSVKAQIVATQSGSGTPSPSNVRAIYGFSTINIQDSGKNLLDLRKQTDGTLNGEVLSVSGSGNYFAAHVVFPLKANKKYIFTARVTRCDNCARIAFRNFNNGTNIISSSLITTTGNLSATYTPTEDMIVRLAFFSTFGSQAPTAVTIYDNCQVEIANSATAYEAYNGTTYTITLPETIYGGELECVGGSGKKTWYALTNLATAEWSAQGSGDSEFFVTAITGIDTAKLNDLLCNKYKTLTPTVSNTDDNIIGVISSGAYLRIRDKRYTASTINDFKTSLADCVVIYPLATPTTFTTTPESIPTLSGVNNIYADSGDVEVTYFTSNADDLADAIRAEINKEICHAPTVTPSGSDKLLIVQSQGQGLATLDNVVGVKMDKANPTGTGSLSLNRKSGTTTGVRSTTEGYNGTASGTNSHAEGYQTTASGSESHAENESTTASGSASHAEGKSTTASGKYSHAENNTTTASGDESHAEGFNTIANHSSQHVFGQYNVADPSSAAATSRGTYVEIVGKGTANNARSNARTLDWNGNEVLAGDCTIKGTKSLDALTTVQSGTLTAQSDWNIASTAWCYKYGNLVSFSFDCNKVTDLTSGWNDIALLPTGFRPTETLFLACNDPARSDGGTAEVQVTKYGYIRVYKNAQQSNRVRVSATYIVP